MEEYINPLAVTHLLQHTLRSLCTHENSQWVYAVFWRILPRNYPPPKWDIHGGSYDRSRGNRRNWILVWEDGFCNFAASMAENNSNEYLSSSMIYGNNEYQRLKGLQPELFFKMSHEIYNYGEGLIGKVAADHSHKWVHKEQTEQELSFLSTWNNPGDSHPRTWEAQFQSGIKTIALIAVREGVVQLGSLHKVTEDLNHIVLLQKKFSYLESIPGVLLPHPSSSAFPAPPPPMEYYNQINQPLKVTPSMSSLEALLNKLPSVLPTSSPSSSGYYESSPQFVSSQRPLEFMGTGKVTKEEINDDYGNERDSSSSLSYYHDQHHHLNAISNTPHKGF